MSDFIVGGIVDRIEHEFIGFSHCNQCARRERDALLERLKQARFLLLRPDLAQEIHAFLIEIEECGA